MEEYRHSTTKLKLAAILLFKTPTANSWLATKLAKNYCMYWVIITVSKSVSRPLILILKFHTGAGLFLIQYLPNIVIFFQIRIMLIFCTGIKLL